MEDALVSVIVNVYNCLNYLPVSLECVRQQTYANLEVILVDDCSTDGSGVFCEDFCRRDDRFRVIHHEKNTGVCGPRNTGLRASRGEYVYFLDGDDYIHAEAIEALVETLQEKDVDLAVFDFERTWSLTNDIHRPREKKPAVLVPAEQMVFEMLSRVELKWCVSWNKLFKRSLIEGLLFHEYYSIQDQDFNLRVYQRIEKAAFLPEPLYWYFQSPKSLQRDKSLFPKKYYYNTKYRFRMLDYLSKTGLEKKYRDWVIRYGYFQILKRREIVKDTAFEGLFEQTVDEIVKETRREFITCRETPAVKKVHFFLDLRTPWFYDCYVKFGAYGKMLSTIIAIVIAGDTGVRRVLKGITDIFGRKNEDLAEYNLSRS